MDVPAAKHPPLGSAEPIRTDPSPTIVGEGDAWSVARHRDPEADAPAPPSLALVRPLDALRPAADGLAPRFGADGDGWTLSLDLGPGTDCYALGEVAGPLRRNDLKTTCWNSDVPAYGIEDTALYQSHPWVLALRPGGAAVGLLVDTTWRCQLQPGESIRVAGRGRRPSVYVVEADGPGPVLRALAELTGHAPMPPRWALGYHQCRWSYYPDSRVLEIARQFRARAIPCDAIWMDIDYMHGFRCFTFHPERFADPAGLNDELHRMGFKTVWMIDPGIKAEPGYHVYDEGTRLDAWVSSADDEPFTGAVWPGDCVFPDFTRADVRAWWAGLYKDWLAHGVDAVWNDMNEPSVFDSPTKTMPEDNPHRADEVLGGSDLHERYHNVYGMLMVRATREGMLDARPQQRPFVLTRASYLGGHRYAATWTGDNCSAWEDLAWSIPMILNLGLSGQPFSGPDIGGFNKEADGALFARWMGIGALLPFARAHTLTGTADHEPWSFGPGCERICRLALERRSRLMPYLYTVFEEATRTGLPMARPLFFCDPADPSLREADDSFLIGADLLVRARVTREGAPCRAPMPPGRWRAFECATEPHAELPDLLVREGAAIPLGPLMQHVDQLPLDPLTLVAYPDASGEARATLYEDAGDGHDHQAGDFSRATYVVRVRGGAPVVDIADVEGDRPLPERRVEVVLPD